MAKIDIFGIETEQRIFDWREKFSLVYENDDAVLYESIETFHHDEDDGFVFDYKFCVLVADYSEVTEDGGVGYQLLMAVMPDSLHESFRKKVYDSIGCGEVPLEIRDMVDGGAAVSFGDGMCYSWNEVDSVVTKIANVFECMNRLRGFWLDRYWNRIGSTGWDTLDHVVNGKDLFKPAFERYEREKAEAV